MLSLLFPILRRTQTKESRSAPCPEPLLPAISWCCFWQLFWFSVSPLSLCGMSHTHAQMQYTNPFAPEACLHDTRQQRPAIYPMLALSYREQQKDVNLAALLKTWVSICIVQYVVHCRHTQLSFPSYTSDLEMDLFWLKSFAVSAMPSIKKLKCVLKLS